MRMIVFGSSEGINGWNAANSALPAGAPPLLEKGVMMTDNVNSHWAGMGRRAITAAVLLNIYSLLRTTVIDSSECVSERVSE